MSSTVYTKRRDIKVKEKEVNSDVSFPGRLNSNVKGMNLRKNLEHQKIKNSYCGPQGRYVVGYEVIGDDK